jgi:hypothetical protein
VREEHPSREVEEVAHPLKQLHVSSVWVFAPAVHELDAIDSAFFEAAVDANEQPVHDILVVGKVDVALVVPDN